MITGAGSGIGRAVALSAVERGYRVFAGARQEGQLDALRRDAGEGLVPMPLDINDAASVAACVAQLNQHFDAAPPGAGFALINNAGVSPVAPLEAVSYDEMEHIFRTNVFSTLRLTQALLPLLKRSRGRVVNVSSGSGLMAIPLSGAYSASKYAIEALSDVMRVEWKQFGIGVVVVEPGLINTPIHAKNLSSMERKLAELDASQRAAYEVPMRTYVENQGRAASSATSPDAVARVILKAVAARRPATRYGAGNDARALLLMHRLLGYRLRDRIVAGLCGFR
jgi:NAD(P)-dependent dehydrogenase (short-subunit alcohol dehydrogenase family)